MNSYGYAVFRSALGLPLHAVEVHADTVCGVSVYSTAGQARTAVDEARSLGCAYDPDFVFTAPIVDAYRDAAVLFSKRDNHQLYVGEVQHVD